MESVVVLLSGGIGSTVAAARRQTDTRLHPLYIHYGRPSADRERSAAAAVAQTLGTALKVLDLPHVRQTATERHARLTGNDSRPAAAELGGPSEIDGLAATLLAVGAQYAAAMGAHTLVTGQMAVPFDGTAPPLSRERTIDPREFHHAFTAMLDTAIPSVRAVRLDSPLIDLQPFEVIKLGLRFDVPFELTWSCHRSPPPCGTCPGCKTRTAAFGQAALADPLLQPAGK